MNRQQVFQWVSEEYGTEPDYPWKDENAVLRHHSNGKWYAVILQVRQDRLGMGGTEFVDVLNVKCDPVLAGSLRMRQGFFPAYHMNKESWISILLDDTVPEGEVRNLIDLSFGLTAPKKRKRASSKREIYTVKGIYEQDFGCEGRPDGAETMVEVLLSGVDGSEKMIIQPDAQMDEKGIAEGDQVYFEEGTLRKRLEED